jgi:hypothetical protein
MPGFAGDDDRPSIGLSLKFFLGHLNGWHEVSASLTHWHRSDASAGLTQRIAAD